MSHHHYEDVITPGKKKEKIDQEIKKLEEKKARIEKEEQIKNKKAHALSEKLQGLKELRDKTEQEIIETRKELLKYCTHEKTSQKTRNYSGSYLDRAEHHVIIVCDWCGEELDKKVSYGGYG